MILFFPDCVCDWIGEFAFCEVVEETFLFCHLWGEKGGEMLVSSSCHYKRVEWLTFSSQIFFKSSRI